MTLNNKSLKFALLASAASMGIAAGAAQAGSLEAPVVEAEITPVEAAYDWTGFYAGVHGGLGLLDDSFGTANATVYGLQAGYLFDMGSWVVGGEVSYSMHDQTTWPNVLDTIDAKARVGFDAGRLLPYATAGVSYYGVDASGDIMYLFGAGLDYAATDNIRIGAEYVHQMNTAFDYGTGPFSFKTDVVTLRLNYAF